MAEYVELVRYVAKALVNEQEAVQVTSSEDEEGVVRILIDVADGDIGRMIGRRGATINAIRQVVRASAVKSGDRVVVDVREDRA